MEYTALLFEGFEDYLIEELKEPFGTAGFMYSFEFENGYGVSAIKHQFSYGSNEDLFEVAVLYNNRVIYDERFFNGNGVKGWMTNRDVIQVLEDVKSL